MPQIVDQPISQRASCCFDKIADYRFSKDLDFTLREPLPFEELRARMETIYAIVHEQSGVVFTFDRQDPARANTRQLSRYSELGRLPR